jgi:hypothetical protein
MKCNTSSCLDFLNKWKKDGPWLLTAIQIDKKQISTKSFNVDSIDSMVKWIELQNENKNIYFSTNSLIDSVKEKKAKRQNIKSVDWLHIDIDPRDGSDLESEKDRCLELLTTKLPKGVPEPTVVVFSGGGFQGFWKLKTPIPIDGDLGLAEDAKRYNQQLEVLFNGDNCHNIDRIMRLPGTINIPDAKKRKKGRIPQLSKVIKFGDISYDLDKFTQSNTVQIKGDSGFTAEANSSTQINTSDLNKIVELDELDKWNVPDRVKVIIAQGCHPDQPKEADNSRSAWVFDCVCQLVRCEVPDDVIFSILTDPEWFISESILEQKGNVEKYTIRQIDRAKEWAIDPNLVGLNEKFAVIGNMGGKCRIIEEVMDFGLGRTKLTKQSFSDFCYRFQNQSIQIGVDSQGNPKTTKMGKWWVDHPKRRQFDYVVFSPGNTNIGNSYNLWKGFACQQKVGDCDLFLDHTFRNVCGGDWEIYEYVLSWLARAVQYPDTTGEVAIVMRGGRGVGKSFFAKKFGALFGRHFLQVSNSSHLVGNFNSHLRDTVVLFADEAFYAGDKRHSSVLKTLITENTIAIEAKGQDVESAANCVHLIMASNDTHVIPAGGDERRFLVLDVGMDNQQDSKYFKKLAEFMDSGGLEELLYLLMKRDISKFNVRSVPNTAALQEQKLLSLTNEEEWWYNKLSEGRVLEQHEDWENEVVKDDLVNDYIEYAKKFGIARRGSSTSLGKFLKKIIPLLAHKQKTTNVDRISGDGFSYSERVRKYHYCLPSLKICRSHWNELYGDEDWGSLDSKSNEELPEVSVF